MTHPPIPRNARNRSARVRRGFTLLELIVALVIMVVLAASLFTTLFAAFKAHQSAERAVAPLRSAELAMEMIRDDLQSAQPPHGLLAGPFTGTDGQTGGHDADSVVFYSDADVGPDHPSGTGEIKQIQLLVEQPSGSTDRVLVRQVTGNLLAPTTPQPDEEIVCRHVSSFNLRYYDGKQWQDSWDSTQVYNTLPSAVEVTLEIEQPGSTTPLHMRRVFPVSCVSPPNTGTNAAPAGGQG